MTEGIRRKYIKGFIGKRRGLLQIEYSKKAVKYINIVNKSTKKRLKEAIEKIPFRDIKKL